MDVYFGFKKKKQTTSSFNFLLKHLSGFCQNFNPNPACCLPVFSLQQPMGIPACALCCQCCSNKACVEELKESIWPKTNGLLMMTCAAADVGPELSVAWALVGMGCYRPMVMVTGEHATVVV